MFAPNEDQTRDQVDPSERIAAFLGNQFTPSRPLESIALDARREIVLLDKIAGVYYEALDEHGNWSHDATTEIGNGFVSMFFRDGRDNSIFYQTNRSLLELMNFYPQRLLEFSQDSHVLDLGCGGGQAVIDLRAVTGANVEGIDAYIPVARRNLSYLRMGVFEDANLPSNYYDTILVTMSVIHGPCGQLDPSFFTNRPLIGPAERLGSDRIRKRFGTAWMPSCQTLATIERILKPGGRVIFFPMTIESYHELNLHLANNRPTRLTLQPVKLDKFTSYMGKLLLYGEITKEGHNPL